MIEFTFSHKTRGDWSTTITLTKGMTGGQAFDDAAVQYHNIFPDWRPGHPDVTVTVRGK